MTLIHEGLFRSNPGSSGAQYLEQTKNEKKKLCHCMHPGFFLPRACEKEAREAFQEKGLRVLPFLPLLLADEIEEEENETEMQEHSYGNNYS